MLLLGIFFLAASAEALLVPFALAGKTLRLRATDDVVSVYHDFKPVAAAGP